MELTLGWILDSRISDYLPIVRNYRIESFGNRDSPRALREGPEAKVKKKDDTRENPRQIPQRPSVVSPTVNTRFLTWLDFSVFATERFSTMRNPSKGFSVPSDLLPIRRDRNRNPDADNVFISISTVWISTQIYFRTTWMYQGRVGRSEISSKTKKHVEKYYRTLSTSIQVHRREDSWASDSKIQKISSITRSPELRNIYSSNYFLTKLFHHECDTLYRIFENS